MIIETIHAYLKMLMKIIPIIPNIKDKEKTKMSKYLSLNKFLCDIQLPINKKQEFKQMNTHF